MLKDEEKVTEFAPWVMPDDMQCITCIYSHSKNPYHNGAEKASCEKYPFPESKPIGVIDGTGRCPKYKRK